MLHGVQRGVVEIVSPIQEGASRALKPIRDLFGWVGDTLDAKGDVERLDRELREERAKAIAYRAAARENAQLRTAARARAERAALRPGPGHGARDRPVADRLVRHHRHRQGLDVGVKVNQPVVTGDGLIGKVTTVSPHAAHRHAHHRPLGRGVGARSTRRWCAGSSRPRSATRATWSLQFTSGRDVVRRGQTVVTAGTSSTQARLSSLFPPGIPIGEVTRIDEAGTDSQEVHLRAYADLRRLEFVQVLTKPRHGAAPRDPDHPAARGAPGRDGPRRPCSSRSPRSRRCSSFGVNADLVPLRRRRRRPALRRGARRGLRLRRRPVRRQRPGADARALLARLPDRRLRGRPPARAARPAGGARAHGGRRAGDRRRPGRASR